MQNVLSIDVEECFHATELQRYCSPAGWPQLPSRVEQETDSLLETLQRHNISATFFVLGWVAEKHPALIARIARHGHEIGCHSYQHQLVYTQTPQEFAKDTRRAVSAIEDACGVTPRVYRAPSYSITQECLWALDILAGLGFTHDSSIYPIRHDRYGIPGFCRHAGQIVTSSGPIIEAPIATVRLSRNWVVPIGGGGYLRLLPYRYTAAGIRRLNEQESAPACIYFHPWELDPAQPRMQAGRVSRLRTYTGLAGMRRKVDRLLDEFEFAALTAVHKPAGVSAGCGH